MLSWFQPQVPSESDEAQPRELAPPADAGGKEEVNVEGGDASHASAAGDVGFLEAPHEAVDVEQGGIGRRAADDPEQSPESGAAQSAPLPEVKAEAERSSEVTGGESQPLDAPHAPHAPHESREPTAAFPVGPPHDESPVPSNTESDVTTDGGGPGDPPAPPAEDRPAGDDAHGAAELPPLAGRQRGRGRRLAAPDESAPRQNLTPSQRLLLLDTWRRSGLPATDFAALVGVSKHTLYAWKKRFEEHGPAGLNDRPRGKQGSRLPDLTRRTILMLKESHPEWGCQRISDMLARGPALPASASAVARVLREAGYESVEEPTRPHAEKVRRFERAKANQLWQTDLFTFVLKRQNRRVYLVAFLDDHSRYIVSFGLHASQSTALVLETLEAGIASYGPPEEILTDNGPQYVTWRGKSRFSRHLEKRGIRQLVARPKRPQTLGKIERFWGTLWRECIETAVFLDLGDARRRIGLFIDYYNFQRAHRGIEGLVPADRYFGAAPEVLQTLRSQVAANALELARHGIPKEPFYLTGRLEGKSFSVHREGERLILTRAGAEREEIDLVGGDERQDGSSAADSPETPADESVVERSLPQPLCPDGSPFPLPGEPAAAPPPAPGQSALDGVALPGQKPQDDRQQPADDADVVEGGEGQ